jgi:hypothetical protein
MRVISWKMGVLKTKKETEGIINTFLTATDDEMAETCSTL